MKHDIGRTIFSSYATRKTKGPFLEFFRVGKMFPEFPVYVLQLASTGEQKHLHWEALLSSAPQPVLETGPNTGLTL